MKYTLLLLLFLFNLSFAHTQTVVPSGIEFTKSSWKKILTQAKAENKMVFLDAYTNWCRPCKKMDAEVFSDRKVGRFYNDNFVNVKMNMEKGEGIPLAIQYKIKSYPSLMFFNAEGDIMHRIAGYQTVPQFIELGQVALDSTANLAALKARFDNGERDPDFLYDYASMRFRATDNSHLEIAEAYLNVQSDLDSEKNLKFIFTVLDDADSKLFDYLITHREKFEAFLGTPAVVGKIQNLIYDKINDTVNRSSLEQIDQLYQRAYPDKAEEMSSRFRLSYYSQASDAEKYIATANDFMKYHEPRDADEINEIAWNFYELASDRKDLKQATKWSRQAVAMDNSMYNNDTLAALYYRLGKKSKAVKTAKKAIKIARANGQDYSETQRLLDEMLKS